MDDFKKSTASNAQIAVRKPRLYQMRHFSTLLGMDEK